MADALTPVTKTVRIPGSSEHGGHYAVEVTLLWECPTCGEPRGDIYDTLSFDGSRRLGCHGWKNPCGHLDDYASIRREAGVGRQR